MPIVCPTITAETKAEYKKQVEKITGFARRIQIDLMDGDFTPNRSVEPDAAWWPAGLEADFHLMFKDPLPAVKQVLGHQPNLVIIHAEARQNFDEIYDLCRHHKVGLGLALLPKTQPQQIEQFLQKIDHVLIFSGNLGHQGGSTADLSLLDKVGYLRNLKPELEIGWDGGVNRNNASELVLGGVDVLNVGGYIQTADDPAAAFTALFRIADETGTT